MRRIIPAGLIDSGFAALATFAVTIYGARTMRPEVFGYFALFWAAFLMAAIVPAQLWFQPWEVASTRVATEQRIAFLLRAVRWGLVIALASGILAAGLSAVMSARAGPEIIRAFSLTLIAAALISPIQDFVRRMLHVGGRSERAALVSLIQFVATTVALAGLHLLETPPIWIPFSALTLANLTSSGIGLALAPRIAHSAESPEWQRILRSGLWLVVLGAMAPFAGFIVNWTVIAIAGPALLGLAEAARIVGRPVLVVTNGLGLALRPRSFEASIARDQAGAKRVRRAFSVVTLTGGLVYAAAVSFDWPGNVMISLVPTGFAIPWLVPAICLANVFVGISFPVRYELIGLGRERYATGIELLGQALKVIAASAAGLIGGFVIPLGDALLGAVRSLGYPAGVRAVYERGSLESIRQNGTYDDDR